MKICKECKNDIHKEHKIFNYNDLKIQYEINVKNCKNFNRFIGLFNKEKEGENGMYKMLVSIINIILFFYENFTQKKNWKIKYFTYLNNLSKSLIKCLIPQSNGGELKEGKFDENIIYYFYDGKEYNGEFNNGFFNGKCSILIEDNGINYLIIKYFIDKNKFYKNVSARYKGDNKENIGFNMNSFNERFSLVADQISLNISYYLIDNDYIKNNLYIFSVYQEEIHRALRWSEDSCSPHRRGRKSYPHFQIFPLKLQ